LDRSALAVPLESRIPGSRFVFGFPRPSSYYLNYSALKLSPSHCILRRTASAQGQTVQIRWGPGLVGILDFRTVRYVAWGFGSSLFGRARCEPEAALGALGGKSESLHRAIPQAGFLVLPGVVEVVARLCPHPGLLPPVNRCERRKGGNAAWKVNRLGHREVA
jgi:hypothetical protein